MNEIEIFKNERFGEVRVAGTSDNPLFCLADVCKILGLRVDAVQSRLTDDPIRIGVTDSIGREQQMNFVNEKNLYKVIMRSDKPQATSRTIPRLGMRRGSPFHPQAWCIYDKQYLGKGFDFTRFLDPIGH